MIHKVESNIGNVKLARMLVINTFRRLHCNGFKYPHKKNGAVFEFQTERGAKIAREFLDTNY